MKKNSDKRWQEFKYNLEKAKEMVDPRYLIESLGFSVSRETAKEIRGACRVHGGDNRTSFRFNKDTRSWVCFSHKCHEVFGNDIIGLIKAALNVEFIGAVEYLESLVGELGRSSLDSIKYRRKKEKESFIKSRKRNQPKSSIVTEECLKQFKAFRSNYFEKYDFQKETLDFFEIAGGYTDGHGFIRDIIPIRDDKGKLMAYSMRDISDVGDYDFKYILTKDFDKDKVLYNLHNAREHIKDKPLIVVEGFKSVWLLWQYGIKNVVAVMGSFIGPGQRNLLYTYAMNGIVLMFDNDKPGISGCVKVCEELRNKIKTTPIFMTEVDEEGNGLDPSDLDREAIYQYLKKFI